MSSFALDSQTSRLLVSADFWTFWAISIPLTVLVLLTWALWVQRTKVKNLWNWRKQRREARDEEKAKEAAGPTTTSFRVIQPTTNGEAYVKENEILKKGSYLISAVP